MSLSGGESVSSETSDEPTTIRPAFLTPPLFEDMRMPATPRHAADDTGTSTRPPDARDPQRRRVARTIAAAAVLGFLPWVVPAVPALLAGAVPASGGVGVRPTPLAENDAIVPAPSSGVVRPQSGPKLGAAARPTKVVVPRLRINASVVPISGRSGELVPPSDAQVLGWWQEGARAGSATGSTVITGHTVSAGGGAFDHLGSLRAGDRVRISTATGTIEYAVRKSQDVPVAELARTAGAIFSQTVPGRLVLITCSDFNGKVYLSNAVVYADPVSDFLGDDR